MEKEKKATLKTKKEKNEKSKLAIMIFLVVTIMTFVADLYFIINHRQQYVVIVVITLVLVVSAAFLLDELMSLNAASVSGEYNEKLDELIKLQKAIYVNSKNVNQGFKDNLDKLSGTFIQAFEDSANSMIDAHKNIAKVVIRKNTENSEDVISAINKIKIPELKVDVPAANNDNSYQIDKVREEMRELIGKLSDNLQEVAKFDDLIQIKDKLMAEMNELVGGYMSMDMQLAHEAMSLEPETEEPTVEEHGEISALFNEPIQESLPEDMIDTASILDNILNESMFDMPLFGAEEENVAEEIREEEVEEEIPEPVIEEAPVQEQISLSSLGDDPNRQMSADEIAALFASMQ